MLKKKKLCDIKITITCLFIFLFFLSKSLNIHSCQHPEFFNTNILIQKSLFYTIVEFLQLKKKLG